MITISFADNFINDFVKENADRWDFTEENVNALIEFFNSFEGYEWNTYDEANGDLGSSANFDPELSEIDVIYDFLWWASNYILEGEEEEEDEDYEY